MQRLDTDTLPIEPNNIEPHVSQEQVAVLQQSLAAIQQDQRKLKEELMRVFQQRLRTTNSGPITPFEADCSTPTFDQSSMVRESNYRAPTFRGHDQIEFSSSGNYNFDTHLVDRKYKYDVAFLVSQPLLHSTGSEVLSVEPLNCDDEEKAMLSIYK